ncbi:hypothetical protein Bca52824_039574 [Brassica carinata]|uniref:Uncharacterized protein n=1 Tax=Brassica carinata TaxID=52824 RepID=A0A8X7UUQ2_BRACI|nr:hypothetical protein Bca52824_039574 [Brassica carinata]
MPLEYTPLSQLNSSQKEWKIRVLISRVWNYYSKNKPEVVLGMEAILVHEKVDDFAYVELTNLFPINIPTTLILKPHTNSQITPYLKSHSSAKSYSNYKYLKKKEKEKILEFMWARLTYYNCWKSCHIWCIQNSYIPLFIMDFYYIDIRYKLQVKVADHTGSTSFLLFDREVIQLIHKSAYELLEQQVQFNRENEIPQELMDLEGRKIVCVIRVKGTEKNFKQPSFNVVKLSDMPDVIHNFQDNMRMEVGTHSDFPLSSSTCSAMQNLFAYAIVEEFIC